ncbi:Alpha/Beta hydrolase protein [Mucidula mucida]|nr:Alpha/Beta hydrolase protein [Mucidula mucida]
MDSPDAYKKIRQSHLEELAELDLVSEPVPISFMRRGDSNDLFQWTKDSQAQIQAGIANRVFGGSTNSPIDFNNVFMAFMESAAMYLRDESLVMKAVETFREGNKNGALKLLERSTAAIDELAELWGFKFLVICDLLEKHPNGHHIIVGPYCGAFVSKDLNNPFIGIAFKGTGVRAEWMNDLYAVGTIRAPEEFLFGGQISRGFYYPLFSTYSSQPFSEPFSLVKKAIQSISSSASKTVITHVTGHSLGAAYASLCYTQLRIEGTGTEKADLGDLYTFGSPRVGRRDFASPLEVAMTAATCGSAWRIVNQGDYVTKVPASAPWPISRDPFIHVDASYIVSQNAKPMPGPSEIGTYPRRTLPTPWKPHGVGEYYKSLAFATTGRLPSGYDDLGLQMAVGAPGGIEYFKAAASGCVDHRHLVESVKLQDFAVASTQCAVSIDSVDQCALGSFQVGPLVGEIVARGDATDIVPESVKLYCNSLKALCGVNTQCVMRATGDVNPKEASIVFIADGVVVAVAVVAMKSEVKDICLDGTCAWEFADTPLVEKVSEEWQKATEVVFEKLFANV